MIKAAAKLAGSRILFRVRQEMVGSSAGKDLWCTLDLQTGSLIQRLFG